MLRNDTVIASNLNRGYDHDKELAKLHLAPGNKYTIKDIKVSGWRTDVYLKEIEGVCFNSVHFTVVNDTESKSSKILRYLKYIGMCIWLLIWFTSNTSAQTPESFLKGLSPEEEQVMYFAESFMARTAFMPSTAMIEVSDSTEAMPSFKVAWLNKVTTLSKGGISLYEVEFFTNNKDGVLLYVEKYKDKLQVVTFKVMYSKGE